MNAFEKIRSPFDGAIVGEMPVCDELAVELAIQRAMKAFAVMRKLPRFARGDILQRAAKILTDRREEVARLIALEAGKPLYDARGEVSRAIFNFSNASFEARNFSGHEVPLDVDAGVFEYQSTQKDGSRLNLADAADELSTLRQRIGIARRYPIGPILAITPFNFPLNLVLHKVAPAIAVGNSVVIKPAPQAPLTSLLLLEILRDAGLPDNAVQVVHCSIPLAEKMVRDDRFAMVTFTGSAQVGWHIKNIAGKKKVALELGGNGAVIVTEDADLDYAATRCVRGGVVYGGQYCIGVQRVIVHESIYDRFLALLIAKFRTCNIGDPLDDKVDVGPVIDERSAKRIESWISEAVEQGARVEVGGRRDGAVVHPTILSNTSEGMKVEAEEIFGPVITVNSYRTIDQALARSASSKYGLQGGIFTNNLKTAFKALDDWDVGGLMVNDVSIYRIDNMPFGGWKESGVGREGTRYAMEEMSDIKFLVLNYS